MFLTMAMNNPLRYTSATSKLRGSFYASSHPFLFSIPDRSKSTAATEIKPIQLQKVPSLPFVGSLIPQYSKINAFSPKTAYDFFPTIRKKYGDFYSMGIPGLGVGITGEVQVLTDPTEMLKVFRGEGAYPYGAIQAEWSTKKWLKDVGSPLIATDDEGFFGQGETWKRLRTFMQTDLLSPIAARGYVPGMVKAAELASKGAPHCTKDLRTYTSRCSFDLFSTVMFGELTDTANSVSESTSENRNFCNSALDAFDGAIYLFHPLEILVANLGMRSKRYKSYSQSLSEARDIAISKIKTFEKKKVEGELNELEKHSYLFHSIERQGHEKSVSIDEMTDISMVLLIAAVDTTSALLNWTLVHLALNQDVQEKLHNELSASVAASNGILCEDAINRKSAPYLHAVVRENHRLTPAINISAAKKNSASELELHGTKFPKGSMFLFDSYSVGMDPEIVPDPKLFQPERWLDEAVEARKGTPSEVIDHPLFRDPFSHGARKCPGSRVASHEVLVMIAQLVLDWKIRVSDKENIKSLDDVEYSLSATIQPEMPEFEFVARTG